MKKILLQCTAGLAIVLGMASFGAYANTITYNLSGAGQGTNHSYNNQGVTFTGWEAFPIGPVIYPANLYYKNGGPNETGLGVSCSAWGPKCGQHEINTTPSQAIDINISSLLSSPGFSSLSLSVASVDSNGGGGANEGASIWGGPTGEPSGYNSFNLLETYTYDGTHKTHTFTFTAADLAGYSYLEVADIGGVFGQSFYDCLKDPSWKGNILLSGLSATVPEPSELGIFGFGLLAMGLIFGLRRRSIR